MFRVYVAASMLTLFFSTNVIAGDYLLRLETVETRENPKAAQKLDTKILDCIEIAARTNAPFYMSTTIGLDKISVSGVIEELNDGRLRVQVRSRKSVASGESVLGPNRQKLPIYKSSNIDTAAVVELRKPIAIGNETSVPQIGTEKDPRNNTRTILTIDNFHPSSN